MPTVTLALRSQRAKAVPDRIAFVEGRGAGSGPLHRDSIQLRPSEIVLDLVPDRYTIRVEVPGFTAATVRLDVGFDPVARALPVENQCTQLPSVSDLGAEQNRLLKTLDPISTPATIWSAISDNKAATFFQITHALTAVPLPDGTPLSSMIDSVVRLGGSEMIAPDTAGVIRSVIGWRMHVLFVGGADIETLLAASGFKRDPGDPHPTHKRFGYVRSHREKHGSPRLQIVTDFGGTGADVDLDAGAFHRSSPHDVHKGFKQRFPDAAKIYVVK